MVFRSAVLASLLASGLIAACADKNPVVLHRPNCLTCHRPLDANGNAHGIEDAHPWAALDCTDCHGGSPWICSTGPAVLDAAGGASCPGGVWVYDQDKAHTSPGSGPKTLRGLSAQQLDAIDPAYLQFVNPGDLRVAASACGGSDCHAAAVEAVPRSMMAHTAGELAAARYRAGMQAEPYGVFGAVAVEDPAYAGGDACTSAELALFEPDPIDLTSPTAPSVGEVQEQYLVKNCLRCHVSDFGASSVPGDFRSSGCTACHMRYSDDGVSQSADPRVNKDTVPHPVAHQLTKSPDVETCTHCHYSGGRIGISYQGYRESAGSGASPPNPATLGVSIHNQAPGFYLTDEDVTNDWDETPPDLHFEAGMHCVDCHATREVHGDGRLVADTQCAVSSECTDCHGTVRERAAVDPERNDLFSEDGRLWLRTKVTQKVLEVPQTIDAVSPGARGFSPNAQLAMGVDENGFSHTDELECYTCHSAWIPTCYGCHVTVDMTRSMRSHTTADMVPGKATGARGWVTLNDLVLLRNTDGLMAPSMPAERFFLTLQVEDPDAGADRDQSDTVTLYEDKPRTFTMEDGRTIAGFGQRAFNPHTTRRRSQFMACDRCHSTGSVESPMNEVLLDLTHGFGTQRFQQEGCDVSNDDVDDTCGPADRVIYPLDRVIDEDGNPLVVVGRNDAHVSRPLTLAEIERMRSVLAPDSFPYRTEIPAGAASDPSWPAAAPLPEKN